MLTVRFYDGAGWLCFARPVRVLRSYDAASSFRALDEAEAALRDGAWIAGYLSYELGAACVAQPVRVTPRPLLTLGIFGAPARDAPVEHRWSSSPLLPLSATKTYADAIAAIRRRIYDGDVYQVNFTVPFAMNVDGADDACWAAIARESGARYQAYLRDGSQSLLSWSPELFLRFDGTRVETRPMKGTARLDRRERLDDEKNRAEHIMIVDLLRNDLRRICDDVRVVRLLENETYPTFATMTSTIEGTVRTGATLREIVEAVFPCGSVTGAPKRAAIETIASVETSVRDVYCGSIGFLSPERRGWWNVAIRTAQLDDGCGTYHAGGGIVADSEADDEWNEVLIKTAFLARPFELWETLRGDAPANVVDAHLARLRESANRFGISFDETALRDDLRSHRDTTLLRVRLHGEGRWDVLAEPLEVPDEVDVVLTDARVSSGDRWLSIKSSWRPAHRRAAASAAERGCFDGLLANERGEVTEGARTNLFVELDGTLWTPPRSSGLLPGILRETLIANGRARERVIRPPDLERSSALFIGNSARGLLRARLHR